jgi:hypothetical protein
MLYRGERAPSIGGAQDLLAAFYQLAKSRGAEFAGVALWAYLTDKLDRTAKVE